MRVRSNRINHQQYELHCYISFFSISIYSQFSETGNQTLSVLTFIPVVDDDGKYLTCRAENPYIPDSAIEDKWRLVVHCKFLLLYCFRKCMHSNCNRRQSRFVILTDIYSQDIQKMLAFSTLLTIAIVLANDCWMYSDYCHINESIQSLSESVAFIIVLILFINMSIDFSSRNQHFVSLLQTCRLSHSKWDHHWILMI